MASKSWTTDPAKVDDQGRTIIPKEVRDSMGISGRKAHVVYEVDGDVVRLRKVEWAAR